MYLSLFSLYNYYCELCTYLQYIVADSSLALILHDAQCNVVKTKWLKQHFMLTVMTFI